MISATSAADLAKHARKLSVVKVMDFLSERMRQISPEVGRKYWRPLLDGAQPVQDVPVPDSPESEVEMEVMALQQMSE
jgi:hypothetical protein